MSDIAPPTPIQNQTNQTLHFNTEPIESRSNIISSELTAANPQQNILNQILPKILKNNSLSISLQPATSKQSKPVTVPSQSTKNNMIFNNLQPNFGQIRPKKNINNSDICVTVDQNINKSKQIPATRALEMAQEIEIHDLVKSEPIDDSLPIITIDDSCTDEHIPLVDDLQKIYADIPGNNFGFISNQTSGRCILKYKINLLDIYQTTFTNNLLQSNVEQLLFYILFRIIVKE